MRVFGEIERVPIGTEFASRAELAASGMRFVQLSALMNCLT